MPHHGYQFPRHPLLRMPAPNANHRLPAVKSLHQSTTTAEEREINMCTHCVHQKIEKPKKKREDQTGQQPTTTREQTKMPTNELSSANDHSNSRKYKGARSHAINGVLVPPPTPSPHSF